MVGLLVIGLVVVGLIQRPHRPTSVVLVVLDTVGSNHCSAYGYPKRTTPRLTALAAEGLLFEQARTVAPWTLPSHASLFTGLAPSQHGCTFEHRWLLGRFETMAERLASAGRETFGVTTNANASSLYHLDQGFETFVETWSRRADHRGLDDSGIANAEIRAWLERRDDRTPFFLFVNYADAHLPYAPPPPFDTQFGVADERAHGLAAQGDLLQKTLLGQERVTSADTPGLSALYDGEIRAADARLGELLDLLDRFDLAEDTLVIVTSDHGEQLGEQGLVDHQLSLAESLLRVPLVVRFPGRVNPARIPEPVLLTELKLWIEDVSEGRVPDWSPPPDRMPTAAIAQYHRPVDLVDLVASAGGDVTAIDRRRFAAFRADGSGGGEKLLRLEPGGDSMWRVDADGRETAIDAIVPERQLQLQRALDELLATAPFEELPGDLTVDAPPDEGALADLRRSGYVAGPVGGVVGMHASEHWSAGRRAAARGDGVVALNELRIAMQLIGDSVTLLFEIAQVADRMGESDAAGAIERFLRAVGSGTAAPATQVEWAKRRLDELRAGNR